MGIMHMVMFDFKPSLSQPEVDDVCHRLLALKDNCKKQNGEGYIVSVRGGRNHCGEDVKANFSHGFVMEFENNADLKYYVEEDPAHLAFVKSIQELVQKAGVVDFTPDAF
ncbi:MAG: hypothetical protein Q9219_002182 [cf. Caloplaca sp. 3 TL-2023]